ncbi:glutaminyl-tRNA synthetase [Austwickia chelonae]|uniref:Glutamine--tRNA ligase n=1 Tax=Austwickia chelonae NBRC 105200 TaxID=1184607 RepID=K6UKQ6_9MICO|nr:glutamine--tRNA ligase/YqeY domain fusion protein [Austwickia chelonae]GAB76611.1 glutaminyl-tRNA synthetase [Austwickia chelonae NBRC 105200]SEW27978.1 glutaminyl-tRNA synthetase [Austwickia chelonae]
MSEPDATSPAGDFVREQIRRDNAAGIFSGRVQTRFPPEPNGYLHIGHAKAICADFGIAQEFDGICHLRFDDTNPDTEDTEYVDSIIEDITWLGFPPPTPILFASDYFGRLYEWAEYLIGQGKAYVDEQDGETISAQRGGFGKPGIESPYRDRPVAENITEFRKMRDGDYPDGSRVLRAKIDMQHENMQMRDPIMYRIRHASHHRTGDDWCLYPTYDWAHGQSDAIEGVTHSLCTLEFDSHRPLYDWFLAQLPLPHEAPRQTEFARLAVTYLITSKRKMLQLVTSGTVDGWDDPRMPTVAGMRRRGYPAASIRDFCAYVGLTKTNSRHDIELLESFVRRELNLTSQRRMAVLRPLKLVLDGWPTEPDGTPVVEWFDVANNPENEADGTRKVPFTGELWIEQDDFAETPPPKFFRLTPGREVRLRGAYLVTCTDVVKDDQGKIIEIRASYDPASRGGTAPDGRKVKSTMHWVSAPHAAEATVSLYERLFTHPVPGETTGEVMDDINPESKETLLHCRVEPILADTPPGTVVQFERLGYFAHDPRTAMHFHRTVGLKDEWAAIQKRAVRS